MLLNVHVKNFALIDEAEMDLGRGLNVITGETGAGKSILIDAVSAALGGRLRGDVIGGYGESAYIELVFSVDDERKKAALSDLGVETEYDCILISRRIFEGRSIHKINDETATAAKVRAVTGLLMDIHGQHEHQSLLRRDYQLDIVDRYGSCEQYLADVGSRYAAWQKARQALARFDMNEEARLRELDFVSFEIREIEEASLTPDEEEELEDSLRRFKNSERLASDVGSALQYLDEGRDNAAEQVSAAVRYLRGAAGTDQALSGLLESMETVESILGDGIRELRDYSASLEYDPGELRRIELRLDEIHHLESKYGRGYDEIMAALERRRARVEELRDYDAAREAAGAELARCQSELDEASGRLTGARRAAAAPLKAAISEALSELGFLAVDFDIVFTQTPSYTESGRDQAAFMISVNPGEPLRPLDEVASGGELSRIMLGVKAVLSDKDEIPSLIFDEIDAGISGRTASKVAVKLRQIAAHHQVICITHLPQIAAAADVHFCIEKNAYGGHTRTDISRLDTEGEIAEVARLLGGEHPSEAARAAAMELKKTAKEDV
ncbi:MAG: DNA repair protein RecN [Lachnospiraceae bacterium]|nr:DNA repair protein RecN [Lachnospiraceae bacterium]